MKFALPLVLLALAGCGHVRHIDAFPGPFPQQVLSDPQDAPARPGDCPDAVVVSVGAWDDMGAPCGGVLVPSAKLGKLIEGYELYEQAQAAYALMADGRAVDRAEAQRIIDATEGLTSEARQAQPRWFVVGMGVGGSAVAVVVAAIAVALGGR